MSTSSAHSDVDLLPPPPAYVARHAIYSGVVTHAVVGCFRVPGVSDVVLSRDVTLELLRCAPDGTLQVRQADGARRGCMWLRANILCDGRVCSLCGSSRSAKRHWT
jgi:hypothetical protein